MLHFYSIHDKAAERYSPPVLLENDAVACRMFKQTMLNTKGDISDFLLYNLGTYNEYAALSVSEPAIIGTAPVLVTTDSLFRGDDGMSGEDRFMYFKNVEKKVDR